MFYIFIFSDAANYYSGNISQRVDMVEVKTGSDELFSVCKNTNMVANHSRQNKVTSESKIFSAIHLY